MYKRKNQVKKKIFEKKHRKAEQKKMKMEQNMK